MSSVYQLPFGPGKSWLNHGVAGALARGWQIQGLWAMYTGQPFSVSADATSLNAPGKQPARQPGEQTVAMLGGTGPATAVVRPAGVRFRDDSHFRNRRLQLRCLGPAQSISMPGSCASSPDSANDGICSCAWMHSTPPIPRIFQPGRQRLQHGLERRRHHQEPGRFHQHHFHQRRHGSGGNRRAYAAAWFADPVLVPENPSSYTPARDPQTRGCALCSLAAYAQSAASNVLHVDFRKLVSRADLTYRSRRRAARRACRWATDAWAAWSGPRRRP